MQDQGELMANEHVPGFEIVKTTIEEIEPGIKIAPDQFDSTDENHRFLLSRGDKTQKVFLSREFFEDLNSYTGSKKSKQWLALESKLKMRLSIPMQIAGLIPFSSDIFFEDQQDREQDSSQEIEVYFSESDYKIFQDGLEELYHSLDEQRIELSRLKLSNFPYAEDQQRIQEMLLFRNEQVSMNGPCAFRDRISVTSRQHLKAAALIRFLFYENELTQGNYTAAVKKEITAKMSRILQLLSLPVFEKTEVAEYLRGIRKSSQYDQSQSSVPDNPQKQQYDVVISFAGEDRDYAKKIAELLRGDDFSVFYDEYEEHALWGKNLYEHLTEVYSKRGKYCVMFLSRYYAEKQWPTLERRAAQERAFKENREYILPIRIDNTEIPGILDTVAYQDLREKSIGDIYNILKKKLSGESHGTLV